MRSIQLRNAIPSSDFRWPARQKKGYLRGERQGGDRIVGRKLKGQGGIPIMPQLKKHIEKKGKRS